MSPVEGISWNLREDWSLKKFPGKLLTGDFLAASEVRSLQAVNEVRSLQAGAVDENSDVTC